MPTRQTPLHPDNCYHIYNRGVNKGVLFFSEHNYQFFLDRMTKFILPTADILAYCLMPNHFHLLIKINSTEFLRSSLHPFLVSYAKAINIEQDRVGPLFQGRYQANLIEDDGYLLDCAKYIHLNPVKAGLVNSPELWKYSSYMAYVHKEKISSVNTFEVMRYFETVSEFRDFIEFGIDQYESKYFPE
jgi:putative transposase